METQRIKQLFDFHKKDPNNTFVLFAIAQEYLKLEKTEEAEKYFKELLEIDQDYGGAYYHLGKLYELKGEKDKAVNTYKEGIAINQKIGDQHAVGELNQALLLLD